MFAFASCLFALLASASLARPAERERSAEPSAVEQTLGGLVRSGDALQLVEEVLDIQGENGALPSDHQFQLLVRFAPDAPEKA
jgi:hypothetical protein